ncbi:MAG: hypothetical protein EA401_10700, partial [Planctomycetota bacterium]
MTTHNNPQRKPVDAKRGLRAAPPVCTLDLQTLGIDPGHDPAMTLRGAVAPVSSTGGASVVPAVLNNPDEILNAGGRGYGMRELLGQGGMGAVYRCKQKIFARSLAAKMILPERDTPRTRSSFLAEAAVVAHLAHPNIIPVHDLLAHPQKGPVLVMKQVQGHEWAELLEAGIAPEPVADPRSDLRRTLAEHLDILLDVCDAMTFAHSNGILHRDLKPQNVMIGAHGEVLVMDWGCAVSLEAPPPHPLIPLAKDLRGVSGTPGYLPPEMALGEHHRLCPASDIYLLGGILYYILTGRPPHRGGDTAHSGGTSHAVQAVLVCAAEGVVPDPAAVTDGKRPCPSGLCRIVLRALHKDPRQRTASASALASQIRIWRQREEAKQYLKQAQGLLKDISQHPASQRLDVVLQAQAAISAATSASPKYPPIAPLALRCRLAQAEALYAQGAIEQAADIADQIADAILATEDTSQQRRLEQLDEDIEETQKNRVQQRRLRFLAVYGGGGFISLALIGMLISLVIVWQQRTETQRALDELAASRAMMVAASEALAQAETAGENAQQRQTRERAQLEARLAEETADRDIAQQQFDRLHQAVTTDLPRLQSAWQTFSISSNPPQSLQAAWQSLPRYHAFSELQAWSQQQPLPSWNDDLQAHLQVLQDAWTADHPFSITMRKMAEAVVAADAALDDGSREAIEGWLQTHPQHPRATELQSIILGFIAADAALDDGSREAIEGWLGAHADHPRAGELRAALAAIPPWASANGRDQHGRWADLQVGSVTQRLRWIEPGTYQRGSPAGESGRRDN